MQHRAAVVRGLHAALGVGGHDERRLRPGAERRLAARRAGRAAGHARAPLLAADVPALPVGVARAVRCHAAAARLVVVVH